MSIQLKKSLLCIYFATGLIYSQNVAINTTGAAANPSAMLDVSSTNSGLLIPRVALTATNLAGPIAAPATSLMIYNTATASTGTANAVTPGYYYWDGAQWVRFTGNGWIVGTSAATVNPIGAAGSIGFFGTTTNSHVDLVTNGTVRGRISNLGEFFIGSTNTVITGDLMNGVSNVTFPWAVNGYSSFNGSGVYGSVQAGTTIFGAVQGEYNGTHVQGTGVRGIYNTNTAGTGFGAAPSGVSGQALTAGSYKFGVYGSGGTSARSGGVMGYDYGIAMGALGYYANSGIDYSVYGFGIAYQTGVAGGLLPDEFYKLHPELNPLSKPNNMVGIGIYGGVMGGWVKGLVYGTVLSGDKFGLYVDGNTVTNSPIIELIDNESENRTVTYANVSLSADISTKGKMSVINGEGFIHFNDDFKTVMDIQSMIVNITPMANSNGFYVNEITPDGVFIKENNDGKSSIDICWSITASRKDVKTGISPEIVSDKFDSKMNGVMFNENNTEDTPVTLWWDGEKVRFDPIPEDVLYQLRGETIIQHQKKSSDFTRTKLTRD